MIKLCKHHWSSVYAILLISLLLLSGCSPMANNYQQPVVEDATNQGRLSLFLNLLDPDGPDLTMQITSIELRKETGAIVRPSIEPLLLSSGKIKDGQQFLIRIALESGNYNQVRLKIGEAGYSQDGVSQLLPLKRPEVVMDFRTPISIAVGDSKSLFFTWDTRLSVQDEQFDPAIQAAPTLKRLVADVAYVACPEIDTVFMVSLEKNRVIDSLGVPGGPTYLFYNGDPASNEVYVLAAKDLKLYVFSTTSNKLTDRYNIPMINDAQHAAFSPNGEWGYIIGRNPGGIVRIDMHSGTADKQVQLNYDPVYISYLEKYNLLAVSLSIAQTVVLLNADTLEQVGSISTGTGPDGLRLIDERYLYIAESGANSVMIYDMGTNAMVKRISVGFQPRRLLDTINYVYVANKGDRSLTLLRYPSLMSYRTISFPGVPDEMAYADKFNKILVGNPRSLSVKVIDALTDEFKTDIELGAVPKDIVVQE